MAPGAPALKTNMEMAAKASRMRPVRPLSCSRLKVLNRLDRMVLFLSGLLRIDIDAMACVLPAYVRECQSTDSIVEILTDGRHQSRHQKCLHVIRRSKLAAIRSREFSGSGHPSPTLAFTGVAEKDAPTYARHVFLCFQVQSFMICGNDFGRAAKRAVTRKLQMHRGQRGVGPRGANNG